MKTGRPIGTLSVGQATRANTPDDLELLERLAQQADDMYCLSLRAVLDLVAAGSAVSHDDHVLCTLPHCREQRQLTHLHRDLVGIPTVAEYPRHAAAGRLYHLHFQFRDLAKQLLDRCHCIKCFLVAVSVHQHLRRVWRKLQ